MRLPVIWPFSRGNASWFGFHSAGSLPKAGFWSFLSNNTQSLFQIVSGVLLARLLVPEDYGKIALVMVLYNLLSQVNSISLSNAVVQKHELTEQQAGNFFWVSLGLATLFGIGLFGAGCVLGQIYDDPDYVSLALIFGLLLVLDGSASVHLALIRRSMRFDFQFWTTVWTTPLSVLIAVLLARQGAGAYAVASMSVFGGILGRFLLFRFVSWTPQPYRAGAGIRGMLRFGGVSTLAMAVDFIYQQSQVFFLGRLSGVAEAGIYNRGQTLFQRPFGQLMGPMLQVFLPALAARQADPRAIERFVVQATWGLGLVLFPPALWVFVFGEELAAFVLGQQWREAGLAMSAFAVATLPWILGAALFSSVLARGMPGRGIGVRLVLLPFFLYFTFRAAGSGAVEVVWVYAAFQWLSLIPTVYMACRGLVPGFGAVMKLVAKVSLCGALSLGAVMGIARQTAEAPGLLTVGLALLGAYIFFTLPALCFASNRTMLRDLLVRVRLSFNRLSGSR